MGMTYEQYWFGDPLMARAFFQADSIRKQLVNEQAWLSGLYTYHALDSIVGNMMRKKGMKPAEYPEKPIDFGLIEETKEEKEEREDQEVVYAQAYMMNMVLSGKNWKK